MSQKISACLVIHNEEELLERCLKSIQGFVDEIIVVHDGPCIDTSLDIAKKYQAKIFIRDFVGEAEYHRPFSYEKSKSEWILQIDADEFILPEDVEKINECLADPFIDGYHFHWPYPKVKGYIRKGPFAQTYKSCLFRKNNMYMLGISHEYPRTYGAIKNVNIHLCHQPLNDNYSKEAYQKKWTVWAKLQAKQIVEIEKAPVFQIGSKTENLTYQYYIRMRSQPIISAIIETIRYAVLFIIRGVLFAGMRSLRIAWYEIRYIWMVRMNIYSFTHGSSTQ